MMKSMKDNMKNSDLKKDEKSIFTVASVSKKNGSRAWSFWESREEAIKSVYGWTNEGDFYSEDGYYDYVVVEEFTLNHPLALSTLSKRKWFKLEYDPKTRKTPIKPCKEPSYWKRVVGFQNSVYPRYAVPRRFEAIDAILNAIGFKEKAGKYSYSYKDRYKDVPKLLREMGFEKMAKEVEIKEKKNSQVKPSKYRK